MNFSKWILLLGLLHVFLLTAVPAFSQTKDYGSYSPDLARAALSLGAKRALVIGIEEYPGNPLPYAADDARRIGTILEETYGFEVSLLITPKKTTKAAIEDALGHLLESGQPNDQVIIYFSGHGKAIKRNHKVRGGYLVPVNGQEGRLSTLIPMSFMTSFISNQLVARHVVFIIDACYSGFTAGIGVPKSGSWEQTVEYVKTKMSRPGRQFLTAGKSDQKAQMLDKFGMSVYSHFLGKALMGEADALDNGNRDGVVTMGELFSYVDRHVSLETNNSQTPLYRQDFKAGDGEFVFVPVIRTTVQGTSSALDDELRILRKENNRIKKELEITKRNEAIRHEIEMEKQKKADLEKKLWQKKPSKTKIEPKENNSRTYSFVKTNNSGRITSTDLNRLSQGTFINKSITDNNVIKVYHLGTDNNVNQIQRKIISSNNIKNRLKDNGDGTLSDFATGLMWLTLLPKNFLNINNPKKYIAKLNRERVCGYKNWRIPTKSEVIFYLQKNMHLNVNSIENKMDLFMFFPAVREIQ